MVDVTPGSGEVVVEKAREVRLFCLTLSQFGTGLRYNPRDVKNFGHFWFLCLATNLKSKSSSCIIFGGKQ